MARPQRIATANLAQKNRRAALLSCTALASSLLLSNLAFADGIGGNGGDGANITAVNETPIVINVDPVGPIVIATTGDPGTGETGGDGAPGAGVVGGNGTNGLVGGAGLPGGN